MLEHRDAVRKYMKEHPELKPYISVEGEALLLAEYPLPNLPMQNKWRRAALELLFAIVDPIPLAGFQQELRNSERS